MYNGWLSLMGAKVHNIQYLCSMTEKEKAIMHEDLQEACRVLAAGGLILYPTDTIWGIGCDATNQEAVERVYALKQRTDSKALIVLVDSVVKVDYYVDRPCELAFELVELSEQPLTIIYDHARNLASNLLAADGSIGIRITKEAFSQQLCARFRKAIVSTSANISGQPSPLRFADIDPLIVSGVDYVVRHRQAEKPKAAKPSGIIKLFRDGQVQVIR
jgi:L-threonylcarbamoyladenylate synthase